MQQKDNQLFSVVCRNSGNAVAPVQIKNLLKEVDTGKLLLRESVTGYFEKVQVLDRLFHAADSMVEEKSGIIILCKYGIITWNRFLED